MVVVATKALLFGDTVDNSINTQSLFEIIFFLLGLRFLDKQINLSFEVQVKVGCIILPKVIHAMNQKI